MTRALSTKQCQNIGCTNSFIPRTNGPMRIACSKPCYRQIYKQRNPHYWRDYCRIEKNRLKFLHQAHNKRLRWKGAAINKLGGQCMDCGGVFPSEVYDFDHIKGTKINRVSTISPKIRELEIAKCDLVCANCHRIRTVARAKMRRDVI